jgi:hypothetical protein
VPKHDDTMFSRVSIRKGEFSFLKREEGNSMLWLVNV